MKLSSLQGILHSLNESTSTIVLQSSPKQLGGVRVSRVRVCCCSALLIFLSVALTSPGLLGCLTKRRERQAGASLPVGRARGDVSRHKADCIRLYSDSTETLQHAPNVSLRLQAFASWGTWRVIVIPRFNAWHNEWHAAQESACHTGMWAPPRLPAGPASVVFCVQCIHFAL